MLASASIRAPQDACSVTAASLERAREVVAKRGLLEQCSTANSTLLPIPLRAIAASRCLTGKSAGRGWPSERILRALAKQVDGTSSTHLCGLRRHARPSAWSCWGTTWATVAERASYWVDARQANWAVGARRGGWDDEDDYWDDYEDDEWGGKGRGKRGGRASKEGKQGRPRRQKGFRGESLSAERTVTVEDYVEYMGVDEVGAETTKSYVRTMGVDLGKRRTGVAVSTGGLAPRTLEVITLVGHIPIVERLMELAQEEGVQEFVVGLPTRSVGRHADRDQNAKDTGVTTQETSQAKFNRLFARKLATAAKEKGIHVWLYDESYTSMEAKEYMLATGSNRRTRRTELDSYAAAALLDHYFKRTAGEPEKVKALKGGLWKS